MGNNPRTTTQRNKSTLSATRPRTASPSARAESRSRSEPPLKNLEPFPRAHILTPKKAWPTPSPGSPMRTVSRPPETICPLLPPCPPTLSSSSLTWLPPENCKVDNVITETLTFPLDINPSYYDNTILIHLKKKKKVLCV